MHRQPLAVTQNVLVVHRSYARFGSAQTPLTLAVNESRANARERKIERARQTRIRVKRRCAIEQWHFDVSHRCEAIAILRIKYFQCCITWKLEVGSRIRLVCTGRTYMWSSAFYRRKLHGENGMSLAFLFILSPVELAGFHLIRTFAIQEQNEISDRKWQLEALGEFMVLILRFGFVVRHPDTHVAYERISIDIWWHRRAFVAKRIECRNIWKIYAFHSLNIRCRKCIRHNSARDMKTINFVCIDYETEIKLNERKWGEETLL